MAGRFSIEAVFKAIDKVTAPVTRMGNRVGKTLRKVGAGVQRLNTRFRKLARSVGPALGVAGVAGALLAVKMAMGAVITKGAEFEQTLVGAGARFEEPILRGTEAFAELEATARRVGRTTEFTANQAAGGLNFMAKAGFSAAQSMALLPGLVDLATASETDLARATDIASDSIGAFGLMTDDAAKLQVNFTRVSDQMAKTVNSTNTDMEQLFETVKKGAPAATAAGVSMQTFLALTGRLAQSGLKASEAGTALKNIFLKLAETRVQRSLRRLGVAVKDIDTGELRDFADIMDDLGKATADRSKIERAGILTSLFGLRGVTGVATILGEGTAELRKLRTQLVGAAGETERLAGVMRDTLRGRILELNSAVESLTLTFFKSNAEGIEGFVEGLTEAVRAVDGFIEKRPVIAKAVTVLLAVGAAAFVIGLAVSAIAFGIGLIASSTAALASAVVALGIGLAALPRIAPNLANEAADFLPSLLRRATSALGFGTPGPQEEEVGAPIEVIGPQERLRRSFDESVTTNQIAMTIRGETDRVSVDQPRSIPGFTLSLEETGALA